jgi:uncharacterized protein (TIRG00374 family)
VILVVVLVAAYGLPALWPDVRKAVAGVAEIAPAVLLGALVLETASLACFSGLTVSLLGRARRPKFGTLLRIDVTVYGLSRVLPAAAATGGALRLRLLTAAGVSHPDAVFLATIEGTGSALLLYGMLGAALIVSLPLRGVDPTQILAAAAGITLVAAAFALVTTVARDGPGLRRLVDRLARWVPGIDADRAAAALCRESEHLRALAADPPRLVAAIAWGAANWLLDATVLWGVLAAVGHTLDPLTLFIAYAVANVVGLLPITPGGVGVVEGVLVPSLVAAGVPAHLALVGVLAWRLVNYWLPIPVGALMWLTLRHHAPSGAGAREQSLRDDHHQQEGPADHGLDVAAESADLVDHVGQHVAQQHPDERAQHAARAAGEQDAADNDGRDRVQLGAHPDHGDARLQVGRRERAREPGQHAARGVDGDLGAGHGQAHEQGRRLGAAGGEHGLAEPGALQHHPADAAPDQRDPQLHAPPEERGPAQAEHDRAGDRVRRAAFAGGREQQPAGEQQRRQRDDERDQAPPGHEQAVDQPDQPAHGQG